MHLRDGHMDPKQSKQIKSSRPIPIDNEAYDKVFGQMSPDTIHKIPQDQQDGILPPDSPSRVTCVLAGSGLPQQGCYAVEQTIPAINKDGETFHKTYRYLYIKDTNGQVSRHDVTHNYSSSTNAQVNDHHQSPKDTKDRLGNWPGFESL